MRATLKSLAIELGVSEPAVSMALHNHPKISLALRERARELAGKRGYIVSPAFARLGGGRKGVGQTRGFMPLAHIVSYRIRVPECEKYVESLAAEYGYTMETFWTHEQSPTRLAEIFLAKGIEAVLFSYVYDQRIIHDFPWEKFSVAAYGAGNYTPPCHIVIPDIGQMLYDAYQRCIEQGYKRIAIANWDSHYRQTEPADFLGRHATPHFLKNFSHKRNVLFHDFSAASDCPKFLSWIKKVRPEVVIGQTSVFFSWLQKGAYRIPQDIAYINQALTKEDLIPSEKGISGYCAEATLAARRAIQILDSEVKNFQRGSPEDPSITLIRPPWRNGKTFPLIS